MTTGEMSPEIAEWQRQRVAWTHTQADALRAAGHTYESAYWDQHSNGVTVAWPILAEVVLEQGGNWRAVVPLAS